MVRSMLATEQIQETYHDILLVQVANRGLTVRYTGCIIISWHHDVSVISFKFNFPLLESLSVSPTRPNSLGLLEGALPTYEDTRL